MHALIMNNLSTLTGEQRSKRFERAESVFTLVGFFLNIAFGNSYNLYLVGSEFAYFYARAPAEHRMELVEQQIDRRGIEHSQGVLLDRPDRVGRDRKAATSRAMASFPVAFTTVS